jgi:hypothetical protein
MLWLALYRTLPVYPPRLGLPLVIVAALFLGVLVSIYRMHANAWPGTARFGFIVSAIGLGAWIVGGTVNVLAVTAGSGSAGARVALQLVAQPQTGWGLFNVGLVAIGVAAITKKLSPPLRLLLPIGSLFLLGEPLKYILGERTGGVTVLVAFGVGWLALSALLVLDARTGGTTG